MHWQPLCAPKIEGGNPSGWQQIAQRGSNHSPQPQRDVQGSPGAPEYLELSENFVKTLDFFKRSYDEAMARDLQRIAEALILRLFRRKFLDRRAGAEGVGATVSVRRAWMAWPSGVATRATRRGIHARRITAREAGI
ncbi:unnamed protein product [Chrysodeixis includens]|uniref:Uncharacterized protein n=1 Tax=Chrysodeixis includens TaxID=689277 RepID=A0A9N8Q065_CHRIL|nr:unnamed protein product [Chrysodeixis includens]